MSGNDRPRRRYRGSAGTRGTSGNAGKRGANDDAAAAKRDTARRANLPRRTAYDVLKAVRDREAYANLLLPRLLADRQLTGRDAALATELAYGTLRGQGTYDAVLAACSDRPLDKLDPPVLDILRLGTHQLLSTRVGAHAAVATSVDLAKSVVGPRVSGYVNAVLRRVSLRDLDSWLAIVAPSPATDADGYLATRYSHPRWIVTAYRAALGDTADDQVPAEAPAEAIAVVPEADDGVARDAERSEGAPRTELAAALAAGNARPKVTMATFPAGAPREDVMPPDAVPGRWSPYAFTLESGDPAPLIEAGTAVVQDEGSQLAAIALSRAPVQAQGGTAELWLDMCAGPGGKARLLAGLAVAEKAALVAAELHPHRAALVASALARVSKPGVGQPDQPPHEVIVADGTNPAWREGAFDRVLLDVPCSGLGALRRRPEARWRKSEADLKELTALQRDLLRSALKAVRPGGVVTYVTCSPVPAETSDVVTDVAASLPGIEVLDTPAVFPEIPSTAAIDPRFVQLWPHRHGTDAIFIALLRRGTENNAIL
jgi:16S rRNA (cytosine967-C5)-methyltransferase